jgi:hypothetical protein
MPHLTFDWSPDGMVVGAVVGTNRPDTLALLQAGKPVPTPVRVRALLDSGADATAVAPPVLHQLGLTPVRSAGTQTAGGSVAVGLYRISLTVHGPGGTAGPMLVQPNLLATELAVPLSNIDALIGLDVLGQCLLVVDGPGQRFTLAF